MSTQRGNVKKPGPKHQNSFAFKHNPKSKKTLKILALPSEGLCRRCSEQIEWRKKYRKYKPLTKPGTCNACHKKTITSAYHTICDLCAAEKGVCTKCCKAEDIMESERQRSLKESANAAALEESMIGMRERDRRTLKRCMEREANAFEMEDNSEMDVEEAVVE